MTIYYENNNSERADFNTDEIFVQSPETLFSTKWSYSAKNSVNFGGKIKKFFKSVEEKQLQISIMADTETRYNELMQNLHDIFEYDVRIGTPGKLYVNDYYLECYIFGASYGDYEELFESVEKTLQIVSEYPMFIKEITTTDFDPEGIILNESDDAVVGYAVVAGDANEIIPGTTLDAEATGAEISNAYIAECNFKLEIEGYAYHPYIVIGSNVYNINCEIEKGSRLVIDSIAKKVVLVDKFGEEENVFYCRNKEYDQFAKIPLGKSRVVWNGDFTFKITLYEERAEARWI